MIGSSAPRMLGLLARYAEIWNGWGIQTVEQVLQCRDKVDAAMTAAGRDPVTVERSVALLVDFPDGTGRPSEREVIGLKARTPEELAEHLIRYAEAGIGHVQLMLDPNTLGGLESAARALEYLDRL